MITDPSSIVVIVLAGLAAAGLVDAPVARIRRLSNALGADRTAVTGFRRPAGGQPSVGTGRVVSAMFATRPDALPLRTRILVGASGGIAAAACWQAMSARAPDVVWIVAPVIAGLLIVLLGRIEAPWARERRLRMIKDLPHVLELLAAAMAAGLPLRGAVREVVSVSEGPLVEDLSDLLKSIDLGSDDAQAWRRLRDHPALGRVSVDLARSVESGTMVVSTLRRHAVVARRQRRGVLEAQARTVGVKSVPPLVFCFVPAFLLVSIVPAAVTALRGAIF